MYFVKVLLIMRPDNALEQEWIFLVKEKYVDKYGKYFNTNNSRG